MTVVKRKLKLQPPAAHKDDINGTKSDLYIPKKTPVLPHRIVSRIVFIFSLLCVVYFSTKPQNVNIFAKQSEKLPERSQKMECSEQYRREVDKFKGCVPVKCGRLVSDSIVTHSEADALLEIAKKGLALGGSNGGASILDLHSGALSMGTQFLNIYKINDAQRLFTMSDFNTYKAIKQKIMHGIAHHFGIRASAIFLTHPTFFSEITSKEAVTIHDEYWHPHVDKETYASFHYTSLLYLNDYSVDFEGGRFVFVDENVNRTVEPRKGRVSMFTSGAENLHYVERVTSGVRYAITISFTCDHKYAIREPSVDSYSRN